MTQAITTTFHSVRWEESEVAPAEGLSKITRASCEQVYEGDVTGTSTLEYLMIYRESGDATFVGVERVVGSVNGREGSFALRHEGAFESGVAKMRLAIVSNAGTGELRGMRGEGTFESPHAPQYTLTLHCTFDEAD